MSLVNITPLTDLATVKARLGIPASDTSQDEALELIIAAVDLRIYKYCNRDFTNRVYIESGIGTDDNIILLRNPPIARISYKGRGHGAPLTIKYTGSSIASVEVFVDSSAEMAEMILHGDAGSVTSISLAGTFDATVDLINAEADWEATVEDTYGGYIAAILENKAYPTMAQNESITLSAPIRGMTIRRTYAESIYESDRPLAAGEPHVVIYNGGFAEIPADLKEAATQISVNTYDLSEQDQNLSSEKIGDYAWTRAAGDFLSQVIPSWYTFLATYKNPSMG